MFVYPFCEKEMRLIARRSVVAIEDIKKDALLNRINTGLKRPGDGLPPQMFDLILGMKANRNVKKGERISIGDVRNDG
jgi:sialic acid synthase SpsE